MSDPSPQPHSRAASLWLPLYHLLLYPVFLLAMRIASIRSRKIRTGLAGRKNWRKIAATIAEIDAETTRIHFHASSVGEFEQAKPLIEALRADGRSYRITASFFSSSGYEQQKNYPGIDAACYLPFDRAGEMNEFINWLCPDLIVIVRYDLWLEFLRQARRRRIPIVLICGVLRRDSIRFAPPLRSFFRFLYGYLTTIHAVGPEDWAAFADLVPHVPLIVSGDTRYDRVAERARSAEPVDPALTAALAGRSVLVAGSTWPDDENLLAGLADLEDLSLVLVPHEPTADHVAALREKFPTAVTLSDLESGAKIFSSVVIVDRTGVLLRLYKLANIAWVGGGFGAGVHSVLEPAAHGIPVFSGPGIDRSRDATAMHAAGALTIVRDGDELRNQIEKLLADPAELDRRGEMAGRFVAERTGATDRILTNLGYREEKRGREGDEESGR